jgi:coenzyme PQQ precursor peptide PqqA
VKGYARFIILTGPAVSGGRQKLRSNAMAWSQPIIVEICVGMEITSYESAEI